MKKIRNLLLGALLVFSLPSLSACGFFAEEENGYLISDVTTDVDNQGNTVVTISFNSEDKPSVSFTLPKGADGKEGVSIKDVTSEFQEEYNRVKLTVTFTDSNKEPFVTYIPVYNGVDGRGIANINVETLENGNQQITISFTDNSSPVSFIVPKGQDGVSIKEITTSYDPISYDVIVTISFTDDSPSVEFRIPRGLRGVSIDYIETQEDENNYDLIIDTSYSNVSDIAETISERGTCLRKNFGAIIVKNDEIISTGYTGAPRGRKNCIDLGVCTKKKIFPDVRHSGYDACRSVHAEQNAMLSAARKDMINADLYLVGIRHDTKDYEEGALPCQMCRKLIINSGIKNVYVRIDKNNYTTIDVNDWIQNDDLLNGKITY